MTLWTEILIFFEVILLTVVLGSLLAFFLWMNLTPGHFQQIPCQCKVEYAPLPKNNITYCSQACTDKNAPFDDFLLLIANLDFYK